MQEEIETLKNELEDKRVRLSKAGSIADAATSITDVFSSAQMTADVYLQEISNMKEDTEKECAQKIEEAKNKVQQILNDGQKQFDTLNAAYKCQYAKWQQLKTRITALEEKNKKLSVCEEIENGY